MPATFGYPCPACRTTSNLHGADCRFGDADRPSIERAYVDVLATLTDGPRAKGALERDLDWSPLHDACLGLLRREHRVREEESGDLVAVPEDERREHLAVPDPESLRTIYEYGSVPGCHDNAVFALIAWYESAGFSWEETTELVIDWLHESNTWARGGFEEPSPEALLEGKRHVYEEGYGWQQRAEAAQSVIERHRNR